jgi:hypothetical protein
LKNITAEGGKDEEFKLGCLKIKELNTAVMDFRIFPCNCNVQPMILEKMWS